MTIAPCDVPTIANLPVVWLIMFTSVAAPALQLASNGTHAGYGTSLIVMRCGSVNVARFHEGTVCVVGEPARPAVNTASAEVPATSNTVSRAVGVAAAGAGGALLGVYHGPDRTP